MQIESHFESPFVFVSFWLAISQKIVCLLTVEHTVNMPKTIPHYLKITYRNQPAKTSLSKLLWFLGLYVNDLYSSLFLSLLISVSLPNHSVLYGYFSYAATSHLIYTRNIWFQHATHLLSIPRADKYILLFHTISFLANLSTVSHVSADIQLFFYNQVPENFWKKKYCRFISGTISSDEHDLYHTFAVQYDVLYCFSTAIWGFTKLLPSWGWCCAQWKDVWYPSGINYG